MVVVIEGFGLELDLSLDDQGWLISRLVSSLTLNILYENNIEDVVVSLVSVKVSIVS